MSVIATKKPRRWREVTMAELNSLWHDLHRKGVCYNGCTHVELVRRYGADNIKHKMGVGWFKLTNSPWQGAKRA